MTKKRIHLPDVVTETEIMYFSFQEYCIACGQPFHRIHIYLPLLLLRPYFSLYVCIFIT